MKDREYFERLISDMLDGPLPDGKADELERHLAESPESVRFLRDALDQSRILQRLPEVAMNRPLEASRRKGVSSVWRLRLAVPLPVAAAVAILVAGLAWVSLRPSGAPSERKSQPVSEASVQYVQIEKLAPASAVLVSSSEENKRGGEDD